MNYFLQLGQGMSLLVGVGYFKDETLLTAAKAEIERLTKKHGNVMMWFFDFVCTPNQIPTGQRNNTLARLAGTMRRVGMARDLSRCCARRGTRACWCTNRRPAGAGW